MKMIIVIVKDNDADKLTEELTTGGFRITRIASTSGFLRSGVVTLLIGVDDNRVETAIKLMREKLGSTTEKKATLFVVPVEKFEQV